MIAYCGLDCSRCDAYLATIEDSDKKRRDTAQAWSALYRHAITPEQINCRSCKSDGTKFFHCTGCEIRRCCTANEVAHCAQCPDYICDALADFIQLAPEAGRALEQLRRRHD